MDLLTFLIAQTTPPPVWTVGPFTVNTRIDLGTVLAIIGVGWTFLVWLGHRWQRIETWMRQHDGAMFGVTYPDGTVTLGLLKRVEKLERECPLFTEHQRAGDLLTQVHRRANDTGSSS